MVSSKKKRFSLRFHLRFPYFSPKIRVFSKKKKKGLHFDFISDFSISLPKSGCSLKKKNKVLNQNRSLKKHLQRIQNCICCFRGGTAHSPHPISTTAHTAFIPRTLRKLLEGTLLLRTFTLQLWWEKQ